MSTSRFAPLIAVAVACGSTESRPASPAVAAPSGARGAGASAPCTAAAAATTSPASGPRVARGFAGHPAIAARAPELGLCPDGSYLRTALHPSDHELAVDGRSCCLDNERGTYQIAEAAGGTEVTFTPTWSTTCPLPTPYVRRLTGDELDGFRDTGRPPRGCEATVSAPPDDTSAADARGNEYEHLVFDPPLAFEIDKTMPSARTIAQLEKVAATLRQRTDIVAVELTGYPAAVHEEPRGLDLVAGRMTAVERVLIAAGLDPAWLQQRRSSEARPSPTGIHQPWVDLWVRRAP